MTFYTLYWRVVADVIVDVLSHLHTSLLNMLITKQLKLMNSSFLKTYDFDNEQSICNQKLTHILKEELTSILCKVLEVHFSNFQRHIIIHCNVNIQCYFCDLLTYFFRRMKPGED